MELVDALDATFDHTAVVIAGVRPDQYDNPRPCAGWTVRDLLEHMISVVDGIVLAGINLLDTATHAWDLAVATGQPSVLPDTVAAAALDASTAIIRPEIRAGRFGPAIAATPTERLVAFPGRQP